MSDLFITITISTLLVLLFLGLVVTLLVLNNARRIRQRIGNRPEVRQIGCMSRQHVVTLACSLGAGLLGRPLWVKPPQATSLGTRASSNKRRRCVSGMA